MTLQRELESLREERTREKDFTARRAKEDEEELQILRERCETLEAERAGGGQVDSFLNFPANALNTFKGKF